MEPQKATPVFLVSRMIVQKYECSEQMYTVAKNSKSEGAYL